MSAVILVVCSNDTADDFLDTPAPSWPNDTVHQEILSLIRDKRNKKKQGLIKWNAHTDGVLLDWIKFHGGSRQPLVTDTDGSLFRNAVNDIASSSGCEWGRSHRSICVAAVNTLLPRSIAMLSFNASFGGSVGTCRLPKTRCCSPARSQWSSVTWSGTWCNAILNSPSSRKMPGSLATPRWRSLSAAHAGTPDVDLLVLPTKCSLSKTSILRGFSTFFSDLGSRPTETRQTKFGIICNIGSYSIFLIILMAFTINWIFKKFAIFIIATFTVTLTN
jgi:hypothetical protein